LRDVGAGAEAWISQPERLQALERRGVIRRSPRLDQRLAVVGKAEPVEVGENRPDELGPAAARVEILDPQQPSPARGARRGMAERRRKGMAEVEQPGRRWREAAGRHCCNIDS
jgi:hypothetical protein